MCSSDLCLTFEMLAFISYVMPVALLAALELDSLYWHHAACGDGKHVHVQAHQLHTVEADICSNRKDSGAGTKVWVGKLEKNSNMGAGYSSSLRFQLHLWAILLGHLRCK